MLFPAAILLVNNDLSLNAQQMLVRQLNISEVIDGYTYDNRIAANASYPAMVHNGNKRLLVVRSLTELNNRSTVDVVGFIKGGMIAIIPQINCSTPGQTYPIVNLTWAKLLIGATTPVEDDDNDHHRIFHDDTQNYTERDTRDLNHLDRDDDEGGI